MESSQAYDNEGVECRSGSGTVAENCTEKATHKCGRPQLILLAISNSVAHLNPHTLCLVQVLELEISSTGCYVVARAGHSGFTIIIYPFIHISGFWVRAALLSA